MEKIRIPNCDSPNCQKASLYFNFTRTSFHCLDCAQRFPFDQNYHLSLLKFKNIERQASAVRHLLDGEEVAFTALIDLHINELIRLKQSVLISYRSLTQRLLSELSERQYTQGLSDLQAHDCLKRLIRKGKKLQVKAEQDFEEGKVKLQGFRKVLNQHFSVRFEQSVSVCEKFLKDMQVQFELKDHQADGHLCQQIQIQREGEEEGEEKKIQIQNGGLPQKLDQQEALALGQDGSCSPDIQVVHSKQALGAQQSQIEKPNQSSALPPPTMIELPLISSQKVQQNKQTPKIDNITAALFLRPELLFAPKSNSLFRLEPKENKKKVQELLQMALNSDAFQTASAKSSVCKSSSIGLMRFDQTPRSVSFEGQSVLLILQDHSLAIYNLSNLKKTTLKGFKIRTLALLATRPVFYCQRANSLFQKTLEGKSIQKYKGLEQLGFAADFIQPISPDDLLIISQNDKAILIKDKQSSVFKLTFDISQSCFAKDELVLACKQKGLVLIKDKIRVLTQINGFPFRPRFLSAIDNYLFFYNPICTSVIRLTVLDSSLQAVEQRLNVKLLGLGCCKGKVLALGEDRVLRRIIF